MSTICGSSSAPAPAGDNSVGSEDDMPTTQKAVIKLPVAAAATFSDPLSSVMPLSESEPNPYRIIIDTPTSTLDATAHHLSISACATIERIRLVDCRALVVEDHVRIAEFLDFPVVPYAAISYPWRGVAVEPSWHGSTFAVDGATDADPVGADALRHACAAALKRGCAHLWLDRLCIVQTSKEDKHWQIRHMYRVYQSCKFCIVLPGGVQRLVRLDEETTWIHRSWTLQEVLAPPEAVVLFAWRLGFGSTLGGGMFAAATIEEAIPGTSAFAPLALLLEASTAGTLSFLSAVTRKTLLVEVSIFSALPVTHSYNDIPFWRPQRRILASNVSALSIAMDPVLMADPDTRAHAVWQSALMRTSSRPRDMVLSIMGLFGVTLDPATFNEDDRRGATIALARAILDAGGSATWLGVGFRVEPDRTLSTFPTLPRTSVAGTALVHTLGRAQEVSELVDPVYPVSEALVPFPKGRMEEDGYLTFTAKAIEIQPASREDKDARCALDGSLWQVRRIGDTDGQSATAYAALLGWFNRYYPGMTSAHDTENIRVMLLQQHAPNKFHIRSFFSLHQRERNTVLAWAERAFSVGGPQTEGMHATLADPIEVYPEKQQAWPRVPTSKPIVTVEDEFIRKARWATPQQSLERHQTPKA